jgi:hypothetical protein
MDATTHLYLLSKMDLLRDEQIRQSALVRQQLELLGELLRAVRALPLAPPPAPSESPSLLKKWLPLLKPIGLLAVQSAAGTLAIAYALKGGDIMTALSTLLKLL